MSRGDHIYVHYPSFTHHGIDCGDGTVIHYSRKGCEGIICRISMADFAAGRQVFVEKYYGPLKPDTVIRRAESRLNEKKYNLVFNNCEHFATSCKTGKHYSEQVDHVSGKFAGSGVVVAVVGGIINVTSAVAHTANTVGASLAEVRKLF